MIRKTVAWFVFGLLFSSVAGYGVVARAGWARYPATNCMTMFEAGDVFVALDWVHSTVRKRSTGLLQLTCPIVDSSELPKTEVSLVNLHGSNPAEFVGRLCSQTHFNTTFRCTPTKFQERGLISFNASEVATVWGSDFTADWAFAVVELLGIGSEFYGIFVATP